MKTRDHAALMNCVAVLALVALGVVACQGDYESEDGPLPEQEQDSAGIRIVENASPPEGSRLGWRIGPEPTVTIGGLEGEGPYMLYRAYGASKLPDGRIVVADNDSGELRAFDAQGNHLATWAGKGEGPGEVVPRYGHLATAEPWQGDSIMAWYTGQGGVVSIYDAEGNFGRSLRFGGPPPDIRWPEAPRTDGTILVTTNSDSVEIWNGDKTLSVSLGYHLYGERYEVPVQHERERSTYPVVFRQNREVGLWGDLFYIGSIHGYEIKAYRADGTLARIVRRGHVPRAPTQADYDYYVSQLPVTGLAHHESAQIAESFPAFSEFMGDGAGYLWVREYDFPLEERPAPLWTVFDAQGRALGFMETPPGLDVLEIGEDYILGRVVAERGVESIQLWPLERVGG
ncbi:MAG: hypothetical protein F4187_03075 [Gemmatimonadetes bacterium]|nr:hypothetical protein [Gemmatimonadota bacterium]